MKPFKSRGKRAAFSLLPIFLFLGGCAIMQRVYLNQHYGAPNTETRSRLARQVPPAQAIHFITQVKPILDHRCVVCHACYDSPCQLKLSSYEGLERGGSKKKIYDTTRLNQADPTRLFVDALSAQEWRHKTFHPVLNERGQSAEGNRTASVLARMLELKKKNPLPQTPVLPDTFDLSLDRKQQCPAIEEFDRFAKKKPQWGMPYGFPGLSGQESTLLTQWVEEGAPYAGLPPFAENVQDRLSRWEAFLNGDSVKEQLMSRYLYEHLFLAHLYFDDLPKGEFFEMVRSKTPPGQPLELVVTRRVFDNPHVKRVYYRLRRDESTVVSKRHLPYALNEKRMAFWKDLFLSNLYQVDRLPTYDTDTTSNPFATFKDIPVRSRYKFLLDEAQFSVMGFIKGPVCRGQVALNVIHDQFWIFFVNPDAEEDQKITQFLAENNRYLELPAKKGSRALIITTWKRYASLQKEYLEKKASYIKKNWAAPSRFTLKAIWDGGEAKNLNAVLTVFRHFDSATVVKGLVGEAPKTSCVMGYALLERIHYLLVAGYDVYGNVGHQVNTRLYMDFLRMEAESHFLALLPKEERAKERDLWYQGADKSVKEYVYGMRSPFDQETGITYTTDHPKRELYDKLKRHLSAVLDTRHEWAARVTDPLVREELRRLAALQGRVVGFLPEVSVLRVEGVGHFTLLRNSEHANITSILDQKNQRLPDQDTLTVAYGFIGDYPEMFFDVTPSRLSTFVDAVANLKEEADYSRLLNNYGIRRTDPGFWSFSDKIQTANEEWGGIEAGLLDLSRYQNR